MSKEASFESQTEAGLPVWDTDLSLEQIKHLKPLKKGLRIKSSLARKIDILELWALDGLPENETAFPRDRAKLRRWQDPGRRLWAWVDAQVDAPRGRNDQMMNRFHLAIKAIHARGLKNGTSLDRQVKTLKMIIVNLEQQNLRLLDEIRQLQKRATARSVTRR